MPKHSRKTLLAHQQLLVAMELQLEALAASHPTHRQELTTVLRLLKMVPSLGGDAEETLPPDAAAEPEPPYDAPDEEDA